MNLCGIIVEYNPFHNGHLKHIDEALKITKADGLIACMSGNFTQRGEASIIDKFQKTQAALDHGVNIVVELPFFYTCQNATIFADQAVKILNHMRIAHLVFGSETNDLDNLQSIAEAPINVDHLKELMKDGISYPKAYSLLQGSFYPNDILNIAYLKALKDTKIIPHAILRESAYHGDELTDIASAKAIRNALKKGDETYKIATPLTIDHPNFHERLYPYLRTTILTEDLESLSGYHLVNEGLEKALKDQAMIHEDYEGFINALVNKRYTKARIQRTILMIMLHLKKTDVAKLQPLTYARILGFDDKGREILKALKEQGIPYITQFKKIPQQYRDSEWKSDLLYASLMAEDQRETFLQRELSGPIIK